MCIWKSFYIVVNVNTSIVFHENMKRSLEVIWERRIDVLLISNTPTNNGITQHYQHTVHHNVIFSHRTCGILLPVLNLSSTTINVFPIFSFRQKSASALVQSKKEKKQRISFVRFYELFMNRFRTPFPAVWGVLPWTVNFWVHYARSAK